MSDIFDGRATLKEIRMPRRTLFLLSSAILGLASLIGILFFLTQSSSDLTHLQSETVLSIYPSPTSVSVNPDKTAQIQVTETAYSMATETTTPVMTATPQTIRKDKITDNTSSLSSGGYYLRASAYWEDNIPPTPSIRFRGDDPRQYVETRDCVITYNKYENEQKTKLDTDEWNWYKGKGWRMRLGERMGGLYRLKSLHNRSHVDDMNGDGIFLTMGHGEIELEDCGEFKRLPDLAVADVLTEDGVYLLATRAVRQDQVAVITPAYDTIAGLVEQGTYVNYGWSEYSLCMVYRVKDQPGVSQWILLGYGQQLLNLDNEWKGFATSGCGDWKLLDIYGENSSDSILDAVNQPTNHESVWEYCARVGARELIADNLPDHIASDLQGITFHPMNGLTGDYIYKARCGFVEGSDVATVLVCQPHSWGGIPPEIKWSPPTNGGMPTRRPCLSHPYQVGDSVTVLFSDDVIAKICESAGKWSGVFHYGTTCMTAYERHQESGEKEIVNGRHFRGAHPEFEDMTALFMGSYIFDEFLYPKLSPRKIDRDGYFSSFWFPLPEGCTGFETHEVGRGTYKGGWTEPEFFKRDRDAPIIALE